MLYSIGSLCDDLLSGLFYQFVYMPRRDLPLMEAGSNKSRASVGGDRGYC